MFNMRTACDTAHVKSVLWLLLNMLQHVLGNNLEFNFRARQVVNKETPPHWGLLPKTCCSIFRSQSTDYTCAVSQAVRISNIYETFHDIQVPLNFLFEFTGINLVQLNIRRRLKGIHSRSDTSSTGAEGLSFYYPRLLHCLDQMLAVVILSQHRVSSSKTVRPMYRASC